MAHLRSTFLLCFVLLSGPGGSCARPTLTCALPSTTLAPTLDAGSIDVKELHVGLLLVYDKLNKASQLIGLLRASMPLLARAWPWLQRQRCVAPRRFLASRSDDVGFRASRKRAQG